MSKRLQPRSPRTADSDRRAGPGPEGPAQPKSDSGDRRSDPRFFSLEFRAWLGWRIDDERLCTIGVRLIDISRGGACVEAVEAPPRDRRVLLVLSGLKMAEGSVWSDIVTVGKKAGGTVVLRLSFAEPCPESLYVGVLEGVRLGGQAVC